MKLFFRENLIGNELKKIKNFFEKEAWWIIVLTSIILIAVTIIFLIMIKGFPATFTKDISKWGQFGDYFGGVLSALLGFMSLVVLAYTLHSQQKSSAQMLYLTITTYEFQVLMAQISKLEASRSKAIAVDKTGNIVSGDEILNADKIRISELSATAVNKAYINNLKACKNTIQFLQPKHEKLSLAIMLTERERNYK